ncbi:hypothetical protein TNCV_1985031 [Trichonephila clavipes]|nr:hypothetical protein TNCV_1985031 [Trichonephila clavipes]
MNPGSVYSIKMVASVFGGKVVNAHKQCASVIVILAITWRDGIVTIRRHWLVTIRQLVQSLSFGVVLKLHRHLYLYMPSNLCLTQYPGV